MQVDTVGHRKLREWVRDYVTNRDGATLLQVASSLQMTRQQLNYLMHNDPYVRRKPTLAQAVTINQALLIPVADWLDEI